MRRGDLCLPGESLLIGIFVDVEVVEKDVALGTPNLGPDLGAEVHLYGHLDAVEAGRSCVVASRRDGERRELM